MKKLLALLCTLCLSLVLVGCGGDRADSSTKDTSSKSTAETNDTESGKTAEEGGYPVTITNYNYAGDEVEFTYEKAPERVLAVYQGSIEIMIALGLENHVTACYGLDNEVKDEWQTAFDAMNYDDSVFAPDKETVVTLNPDFIISWGSYFSEKTLGDVDYWNERGTGTYINSNTRNGGYARTLQNEFDDILNIGKIFNVEDKARELIDQMQAEIDGVLKQAEGQEVQDVMMVEFLDSAITNYGENQLGGDIITQLGGKLAAPDTSTIGKEDIIAADPEVIFVVYMAYSGEDGEDVKRSMLNNILEDESFANLQAVKDGRVYPVMLGDIYASAARTGDGIKTVAAGLYPELH